MDKEPKKRKKLNTLDKYIIFTLSALVSYTIAHTIIFAITGLEAKVLDGLFYGCFGLEILYCFLIKRFKLHDEAKIIFGKKKKDVEDSDPDESYSDYEGEEGG